MKQKYLLFMFFMLNQLFAQADFNYYKMFNINSNTYTHEKIWLKDNTFLVPISFNTQTYTLENGTVIQNPNFGSTQGSLKMLIARYNDNGEYVSHFTLNSSGFEQLTDITLDNNDNIYLTYLVPVGYILNNQTYFTNSTTTASKYMIIKLDRNGNIGWKKTVEGGSMSMVSLAIANNGDAYISARANQKNIIVDGVTYTNSAPHPTQQELTRIIIGKLNLSGVGMNWIKSSTNNTNETYPSIFIFNNRQPILRVDSQNNVYLAATLYGLKTKFEQTEIQNIAINKEKFFILKYNTNGQLIWTKTPTVPSNSNGINLSQFEIDAQDNLFLMDYFNPGINQSGTVNYWGQTYTVSKSLSSLIKMNTNGNVAWIKQPQIIQANPNAHIADLQYFKIVEGKILAFGTFNGHFSYGNGIEINTNDTFKWVSLEFNTNGSVDTHYVLPCSFNVFPINLIGKDSQNRLWFALKTSYNNGVTQHYIGTFNFTVPSPTSGSQRLVYFRSSEITLGNENFKNLKFNIYPNPTIDYLNIEGELTENLNYQIYDKTGRIVDYGNLDKTIDVTQLSIGNYILNLFDRNDSRNKKSIQFIKK